ncbi:hypothetical protein GCM10010911_18800 [Paenibacillus nasutitermitis]|uniref:Uncharacterized protein n=1 Tax=Paenibacillus nasutitermitis TaxID=1652958 RepID=A0A916YV85_9BACL|nr:hypothetical protein GCM10010911_18800 [Paenibacillus nasutitermitis]
MIEVNKFVEKYVAVWNDSDESTRRIILKKKRQITTHINFEQERSLPQ